MKKIILLLFVVLITTFSHASDKTNLVVSDSTTLTLNKVYNDVKIGIVGLSQALKAPVTHVYEILCKQQFIKAISNSILIIFFSIIGIWLIVYGVKCLNDKDNSFGDDFKTSFIVIGIIVVIVVSIFTIIMADSIFTGFFNPEYGTIKDIVSFVK